jgi:hypothetical protein
MYAGTRRVVEGKEPHVVLDSGRAGCQRPIRKNNAAGAPEREKGSGFGYRYGDRMRRSGV